MMEKKLENGNIVARLDCIHQYTTGVQIDDIVILTEF